MSKVEETMEGLDWDKRLEEIRPSEETEKKTYRTYQTTNIIIAFLIGLLFGIIISGTLISNLTALL